LGKTVEEKWPAFSNYIQPIRTRRTWWLSWSILVRATTGLSLAVARPNRPQCC